MVFHEATIEDDAVVHGDAGDSTEDADWFKLREVRNDITFQKTEIDKLRKQVALLTTSTTNARELRQEHEKRETEARKKDSEVRKMIKEAKDRYRDLSVQMRADGKEDRKVFEKFISVHDEKLALKNLAMQVAESTSPTSKLKATSGSGNTQALSMLTPGPTSPVKS